MSLGRSVTTKDEQTRTAAFKAKPDTRVVDDQGQDVIPGSGVLGMLAIGGPPAVGYYNDPEKTRSVFREIDASATWSRATGRASRPTGPSC